MIHALKSKVTLESQGTFWNKPLIYVSNSARSNRWRQGSRHCWSLDYLCWRTVRLFACTSHTLSRTICPCSLHYRRRREDRKKRAPTVSLCRNTTCSSEVSLMPSPSWLHQSGSVEGSSRALIRSARACPQLLRSWYGQLWAGNICKKQTFGWLLQRHSLLCSFNQIPFLIRSLESTWLHHPVHCVPKVRQWRSIWDPIAHYCNARIYRWFGTFSMIAGKRKECLCVRSDARNGQIAAV